MSIDAFNMHQEMASRSKYRRLYTHLCAKEDGQWFTSFREIEAILSFRLPDSARRYRPWWANQKGGGHSQALAWMAAGWETANVDMEAETLLLRRSGRSEAPRKPTLDQVLPVHSAGSWPEGLSLSRREMYESGA